MSASAQKLRSGIAAVQVSTELKNVQNNLFVDKLDGYELYRAGWTAETVRMCAPRILSPQRGF